MREIIMPANYNLNAKQVLTLKLTYKFRYLTTYTLARRRNITHNSAYSALNKLTEKGYLEKIHEPRFKLLGKSARYCLTPDAVKLLSRPEYELNKNILLIRRRESEHSNDFIDRQVVLSELYLDLKQRDDNLTILTGSEIAKYDHFIKPHPDLYVKNPNTNKKYLIELTDHQHIFMVKKRIRNYIKHFESSEWEWGEYPAVILLRSSEEDQKRLKDYIATQMDENYLDESDIVFKVGSREDLLEGRFSL